MENQKYNFGAIPSPPDERDYLFDNLIAGVSLPVLPTEYKNPLIEDILVLDQGVSSECVACSLSYLRWLTERNQSNNDKPFSPTYIYGNRENGGYMGEGMIVREALQILRKSGTCYYDSLPGFFDVSTAIKQYKDKNDILDKEAHPFRISSFYSVNGIQEIKNAIYNLGGVTICCPVYDCLYNPNEKGEITFSKGEQYGYHAMTLIGWTKTHWIVLNSWGKYWGKDGIGYLPFDYPIQEAWAVIDEVTEVKFKMAKFLDIEGHWAEESIDKAAEKGAVSGYDDGNFHPDEPVTRAQLCSILDRLGLFN